MTITSTITKVLPKVWPPTPRRQWTLCRRWASASFRRTWVWRRDWGSPPASSAQWTRQDQYGLNIRTLLATSSQARELAYCRLHTFHIMKKESTWILTCSCNNDASDDLLNNSLCGHKIKKLHFQYIYSNENNNNIIFNNNNNIIFNNNNNNKNLPHCHDFG